MILTHTHTCLTALCPGLPGWAGTRKVKPIWILLKQEAVSGSSISWTVCKSAPRSRQITAPAPHHCFLQAGCPSCCPTNIVKALKGFAILLQHYINILLTYFLALSPRFDQLWWEQGLDTVCRGPGEGSRDGVDEFWECRRCVVHHRRTARVLCPPVQPDAGRHARGHLRYTHPGVYL